MDNKKVFQLFGGEVEVILYDVDSLMYEIYYDEIYQEGLRLQRIFNIFDSKSELSLLNKNRTLLVSDDLLYVIKTALNFCDETNGLYDISKGMEIINRKRGKSTNLMESVVCSYKDIKIIDNHISLLHPDVLIDLGSIAKGFIVDKLAFFIKSKSIESAYIDARGDMSIFGKHIEVIGIQHPRNNKSFLNPIVLENKSIATSGDYNQFYGSLDNCHIIGKKDLISVSVIADSLMMADVFATCLFLLGVDDAKRFLLKHKNVSAFFLNSNLEEYIINGFENYFLENCKND